MVHVPIKARLLTGIAITLTGTLCLHAPVAMADNRQRCSCPTVKAIGIGRTDCSAAESSNECTIDFNIFGEEAEKRALGALKDAGVEIKSFTTIDGPAYTTFLRIEPSALPDQVLVYLTVAAASQPSFPQNSIRDLGNIFKSQSARSAVLEAFNRSAVSEGLRRLESQERTLSVPGQRPARIPVNTVDRVTTSRGCVEVSLGASWVMYKAIWSDAYNVGRCGALQ